MPTTLDLLCIGHASYDQVFSIAHHPASDEKMQADNLLSCGGGPAANAAVTAAKLGFKAGFCGYLGNDSYGDSHLSELQAHDINTQLINRGDSPTPLSVVLVKPNGDRALINYKGNTQALAADSVDFSSVKTKTLLFDGHEAKLSLRALQQTHLKTVPSVLDAGSLHDGTLSLMNQVDYLVCSEKFALQYAGDPQTALSQLAAIAPWVVITLGEHGLIWQHGQEIGKLDAPNIEAVDTTGAGDAFHGAFAAGLSANMDWLNLLYYASAAGAFCCTKLGARTSLPSLEQHQQLLNSWRENSFDQ
jgi:sulfofructose kinase